MDTAPKIGTIATCQINPTPADCGHTIPKCEGNDSVESLKLMVPTYNANWYPDEVANGEAQEFGTPSTPLLCLEADGVRVVLGSHDFEDLNCADIQVERQPNGWAIFLHSVGGSDPCGIVYFRDDGQSFLLQAHAYGPTPPIEILKPNSDVPGFHRARDES